MDAAPGGLSAGTVLAGRYRVERALGQGGMGAVYLVRHVRTEERLALKLLHASMAQNPQAAERFRREARAPAQIDSDHVVRVVDADIAPEVGGAPFLVMEYLRGRDLEQTVAARGRLAPAEVISYLGQAARALDKAHALGVVHRDLKPENLFLAEREDGSVCLKVLDFGIAKLTGEGAGGGQTATGSVFGTPRYMAPEQAQGQVGLVGPRTDVWALGLIAFTLLTGQGYWSFDTLASLILQIVSGPMRPPSSIAGGLGPGFDAWFARCCARPIEQRFASAGEAVEALAAALGTSAPSSGAYAQTALAPSGPAPSISPSTNPSAPVVSPGAYAQTALPGPAPPNSPSTPSTNLSAPVVPATTAHPAPSWPAYPYAQPAPRMMGPPPAPPRAAPADGSRNVVLVVVGAVVVGALAIGGMSALLLHALSTEEGQSSGTAPTPPATSDDGCKQSCARLSDCTRVADPSCESNCKKTPAFASCAKGQTSCKTIAACALGSSCGGRGPAGSWTCKQAADCEGSCLLQGGDATSCFCGCIRALSPDRAVELAANNQCGATRCEACRKAGNGPACLACFNVSCLGESLMCKTH